MRFWKALAALALLGALLAVITGDYGVAINRLVVFGLIALIIDGERTANMLRAEIATLREEARPPECRARYDGEHRAHRAPCGCVKCGAR